MINRATVPPAKVVCDFRYLCLIDSTTASRALIRLALLSLRQIRRAIQCLRRQIKVALTHQCKSARTTPIKVNCRV